MIDLETHTATRPRRGLPMRKVQLALASVVTVVGLTVGAWMLRGARAARHEASVMIEEAGKLKENARAREVQLVAEQRRFAEAEAENARLLQAADALRAPPPVAAPAARISDRYARARQRAADGEYAGALEDYLWCYDVGYLRTPPVLEALKKLAALHPPALAALRHRRLLAQERVQADANDADAIDDLFALDRVLKEESAALELYDRLPVGDSRRAILGRRLAPEFVARRRYADAQHGVQDYPTTVTMLEAAIQSTAARAAHDPVLAGAKNDAQRVAIERARQAQRNAAIVTALATIEVLAGVGDVERARALGEKLLAYDATPQTRAWLHEKANRAGHPEIVQSAPD